MDLKQTFCHCKSLIDLPRTFVGFSLLAGVAALDCRTFNWLEFSPWAAYFLFFWAWYSCSC